MSESSTIGKRKNTSFNKVNTTPLKKQKIDNSVTSTSLNEELKDSYKSYFKYIINKEMQKAKKARERNKIIKASVEPFPSVLCNIVFENFFNNKEYKTCKVNKQECRCYSVHPDNLSFLLDEEWWKIIDVIPKSNIKNGSFEIIDKVDIILQKNSYGSIIFKFKACMFNNSGIIQF